MMTTTELRKLFLEYFQAQQHTIVPSSSLVPHNDATLLFTNAGMVQFKDVFLGVEQRPYLRAASSQRCVRAGGKHNDLENVGYTARHHTFFEMLGNFSFGDYFKEKAIQYVWTFLTSVLKIPQQKLWITVFEQDEEAATIWQQVIGLPADRIIRCGEKDNFWSMGETGPCGPCTEVYYDHGPHIPGGLPGTPEAEGDRYVEIWNLVFMQYERFSDGRLQPLPKPSVDTGMGLERIAAIMQGVHSNYEIDIFQQLIKATAKLGKIKDLTLPSLRVISDHIRSCAFLIMDGVLPANEGRGYVLRRIIRRALRHGHQLGIALPFFYQLVDALREEMGEAYPELHKQQDFIATVLKEEEKQFSHTLGQGLKTFMQSVQALKSQVIPGDVAFRLYDTYGFPFDLTADLAREQGLTIDENGFQSAMNQQRKQSQENQKFSGEHVVELANQLQMQAILASEFIGYQSTKTTQAKITFLYFVDDQLTCMVLDHTPFYTESGGQVGDTGDIVSATGNFQVTHTVKVGQHILHYGQLIKGTFSVGEKITACINQHARQAIAQNHTATHLLHAALRQILGEQVTQKGSLVSPDRLRFDFSHPSLLTSEQIFALEDLVNEKIRENLAGELVEMTPEEAAHQGAMALFGEKYGDSVRTLRFGAFSYEVCGGTHVHQTGEIGVFKIIGESGIAAGVRRIEAVTGAAAVNFIREEEQQLGAAAALLRVSKEGLLGKVEQSLAQQKQLQQQVERLQAKLASSKKAELLGRVKVVKAIQLLVEKVEDIDAKALREMVDQLKHQLGSAIIVLAATRDNKIDLFAGVTKDLQAQFPANELIDAVAKQVNGKGGGRADMAQAGGTALQKLDEALNSVADYINQKKL